MPTKALNIGAIAAAIGALAAYVVTLPSWDALATPQGAGGLLAAVLAGLGGWLAPQPGRRSPTPLRPRTRVPREWPL